MLHASVSPDSIVADAGAGARRFTGLASRPTTVDRALTIITGGSVDVGLAFATDADTDDAIGDAALAWTLESSARSWLLLADLNLHDRLGVASGHSMIRVVERPSRADCPQVGVIALLPPPTHRQQMYLRSRRTANRMCDLLDLGGIAAATVFCSSNQRFAVASRLRRRGVVAGFCSIDAKTPITPLQERVQRLQECGSQLGARLDASTRQLGNRLQERGRAEPTGGTLIDLR